jgi:sirohydrochlorin cobaltochelatase
MFSNSSLILVAHGSSKNRDSSAPTYAHAETIRKMGVFKEVVCAFWQESPSMREALAMTSGRTVYIVPNFISEGYFTQTVIPREFGLVGSVTPRNGRILKYCQPVGNHPQMTELLLRRAREVAPGVDPAKASMIIVGHGTVIHQNSSRAAVREAERIGARGIYAEVMSAYMEQEPFIGNWDLMTSQPSVVVVPFFIADGLHSFEDIPVLMGIEPSPEDRPGVFNRNPHKIRGRELFYASSIGTEPSFAELLLDQARAFGLHRSRTTVIGLG